MPAQPIGDLNKLRELRALVGAQARDYSGLPLGHRVAAKAVLSLADFLEAGAEAPAHVHRGLFTGYTDPLGNDAWGCCGEAMILHGIEGMHHAAGTIPPPFSTSDALALYSAVTGFNPNAGPPGSNPTDNGTDNGQLAQYMTTTGAKCAADGSVHTFAGIVGIDITNPAHLRIGIYEFGAVFLPFNMPTTAQTQSRWTVVGDGASGNSAPGSWGGHDVVGMAYDVDWIDVDSWGIWIPVANQYCSVYGMRGAAFAAVSTDMLSRSGVGPTGLNWTKLLTAMRSLSSGAVQ